MYLEALGLRFAKTLGEAEPSPLPKCRKRAANYNNTADETLCDTWEIREHSWCLKLKGLKIRETAISTGHIGSIVQLQVH